MVFRSTGLREETAGTHATEFTPTSNTPLWVASRSRWRAGDSRQHRSPEFRSTFPRLIVWVGEYLAQRSKPWVLTLGVLILAAIGALDFATGSAASLSLFYLLPIAMVTWRVGKSAGFALSVLSMCVLVFADTRHIALAPFQYWNVTINLGFFFVLTATLGEFSVLVEWVRTDYLTGLANARGFHDLMAKEIHRSERSGRSFSLAYIDIDNFKSINDTMGHAAGDAVLRLVGKTLQKSTRKIDSVARIGGDEFTILLSGAGQQSASIAMAKVEDALRADLTPSKCPVTFTIGIATFREPPQSVEAAIEQADDLMYEAKRMGKNTRSHRVISMARRSVDV